MLKLGSTYLKVKDMDKSIAFYSALLQMSPSAKNADRWAQFDFEGHCIALWSPEFDRELISKGERLSEYYSDSYVDFYKNNDIKYGNNFVLNFYTDNLNDEYKRLKKLNIGEMTSIMLINVSMPYYLFIINDPDGNEIEITGNYNKE